MPPLIFARGGWFFFFFFGGGGGGGVGGGECRLISKTAADNQVYYIERTLKIIFPEGRITSKN